MTIYRGHVLSPRADGGWDDWIDGAVSVGPDGTIGHSGPWKLSVRRGGIVDLRPHLILPGFVDSHAHVPQLAACGVHGSSLLHWLRTWIFPLEEAFRGARAEAGAAAFFRDLVSEGVTSAALYASAWPDAVDACFAAARRIGVRAIIGPPLMDVDPYRPDIRASRRRAVKLLDELEVLIRKWHSPDGMLRVAVTPRFALSCTEGLMRGAAEIARRHRAPIQTHLAETREEVRAVRSRFGRSYLEVYRKAGLEAPGTLFAHGLWLSDREWRAIGEHRASVVHCPTSNHFLGSGVLRWRAGTRVALGSDVGAGPTLSPFEVMRASLLTGACDDPEKLLRAATCEGAEALGMPGGRLEAGRPFDAVVLDRGDVSPAGAPSLEHTHDLISRIVHRGSRASVRETYVQGRKIHEQHPL